jgi:acyl-CoA thioester hydrolase
MANAFAYSLQVRFRDCDAMGHVNNAVYLTYLEETRFAYWRHLWGAGEPAPGVPGVILARAEIDYRRAARYGDVLTVRMAHEKIGRTSITSLYEIVDAAGETIANARTVLVAYDYTTGQSVPLSDDVRARLLAS